MSEASSYERLAAWAAERVAEAAARVEMSEAASVYSPDREAEARAKVAAWRDNVQYWREQESHFRALAIASVAPTALRSPEAIAAHEKWILALAAAPRSVAFPYGDNEREAYAAAWARINELHNEYRRAAGLPL